VEITKLGHRLMRTHFIRAYVKGNKNYANDAEVICVSLPSMRSMPITNQHQRDISPGRYGNPRALDSSLECPLKRAEIQPRF
jgi:transposase